MTSDHDLIDLTPLKFVCSKISANDLDVAQNNLYLLGPGSKYLTIDGGNTGSIFRHSGTGTLVIEAMTIANGSLSTPIAPAGSCVNSSGNVSLIDAVVSHCTTKGLAADDALGGAIYTKGNLHLLQSTITDSHAIGAGSAAAKGGAAYIKGNFTAIYSTVSNNTSAAVSGNAHGSGGGIEVEGEADIEESTISGNQADVVGALVLDGWVNYAATITNSTISSNVGTSEYGGIWTNMPLTLKNSTVAFNRSPSGSSGRSDGLHATTAPQLVSTIIAGNSGKNGPDDLGGVGVTVSSHNNLIVATILPLPADTIRHCPKLDVLADNGGQTLTQGLRATSEAIDSGTSDMGLAIDQRLAPRVTGAQADIGAVERLQSDVPERLLASGFDGLCDQ
jgi:hypothetical protein